MAIVMLILMNIAVMASIYFSIFLIEMIFGIRLDPQSITGLAILAVIVGFSGSIISLLLSKWMAKMSMGVRIIETPQNEAERWLVETVAKLANKANIPMPEVGIFDGPPNAFATGPSKSNALVAVSTSLFDMMDTKEIEGVLAHEIKHIANGDMITMTLVQGVLNSLVFFISRLIANIIAPKDEEGNPNPFAYIAISFALEIVLSIFATMIAMWFSRYREYKADAGAVEIDGPEGIYYALAKLGQIPKEQVALPAEMKAFGIVGFISELFSSHPPIEKRLENIKIVARELGYNI
ncbi:protease HtpX [Caminibacter mediatlanticus]|uniref:Protease HtpX homolog n=1 Tax=Caminibacter mediatlanticus TB-2 TaxID=391592 RepID=A0AAI9F2P7_9BACT|nr:protease HtpX [Caminibacter mediatlanticus]EDM23811.1 HtpX domain protein [Caminibacter mediatlanticus TB-2]